MIKSIEFGKDFPLVRFPSHDVHSEPVAILFRIERVNRRCHVLFRWSGNDFVIPPRSSTPSFKEGLWEQTCFELFFAPAVSNSSKYFEWNFSPSGDWACFEFDGYRIRSQRALKASAIERSDWFPNELVLTFGPEDLRFMNLDGGLTDAALNATAVLEHQNSEKSYWAIQHSPQASKPDFHRQDCFVQVR